MSSPEYPATVAEIFANPRKYNNLIPTPEMAESLPPGVTFRFALVQIDADPHGEDIYKSGAKRDREGNYRDTYSLTKTALLRILGAAQAGVRPGQLTEVPGSDIRRYSATVCHRRADGSLRECSDTYELDIDSTIQKFRNDLERQFQEKGQLNRQVWEKPKGGGKAEKVWKKYEGDDAKRLIEYETNEFEARTRKFAGAIVATKALLRAVKGIFAIRDGYFLQDVALPFVVYWYQFPARDFSGDLWPGRGESGGSHSAPNGSHPGAPAEAAKPEPAPPAVPPLEDRIALLQKGEELSSAEIADIIREVCDRKQMTVPDGFEQWDLPVLKSFAVSISSNL